MTTYGFVFARGGSKGVPRKNVQLLGGRPLIAHSVEVGLNCPGIDGMFVSTEDDEIAEAAQAAGATIAFRRPVELASDTVDEMEAWRHAVRTLQSQGHRFDTVVSLPATSPLRSVDDVSAAIEAFRTQDADMVITVTPAHAHPAFNMVTLDRDGEPGFSFRNGARPIRRQDAAPAYQITGVAFVVKTDVVMDGRDLYDTRVRAVVVPSERAVDIDTPMDLEFARFLHQRRLMSRG